MMFITDVYDSPWWRECMGPVKPTLTRMGFLLSIDAIPAFHQNHKGAPSLQIGELINASLPPHTRYDPDSMIC